MPQPLLPPCLVRQLNRAQYSNKNSLLDKGLTKEWQLVLAATDNLLTLFEAHIKWSRTQKQHSPKSVRCPFSEVLLFTRFDPASACLCNPPTPVRERERSTLQGIDVKPVTLHGNLWSANIASVGGWPTLTEPASYYGHHEAEWGLSWCADLGPQFWQGYRQLIPEDPGFEARAILYEVYHKLVQYNQHGGKFGNNAMELMRSLSRTFEQRRRLRGWANASGGGWTRDVSGMAGSIHINSSSNVSQFDRASAGSHFGVGSQTVMAGSAGGGGGVIAGSPEPRRPASGAVGSDAQRQRSLQQRSLQGAATVEMAGQGNDIEETSHGSRCEILSSEADAWFDSFRKRIEEWWLVTPHREALSACTSALGLHLASRLESAYRSWRALQPGKSPPEQPPPSRTPEPDCAWVFDRAAQLDLPNFPTFPTRPSEFELPSVIPIPRMLPSWQLLQAHGAQQLAVGGGPSSEQRRPAEQLDGGLGFEVDSGAALSSAAALSIGSAVGVALGSLLVAFILMRPIRGAIRPTHH